MARKIKPRKGKGLLAWRSRQKQGAIMKPSTFEEIKAENIRKYGTKRAKKIAGKAYWKTAQARYEKNLRKLRK